MQTKRLACTVLSALSLSLITAMAEPDPAVVAPTREREHLAGQLTFGGLTTEDYSEGIGDVLLPLYFNGQSLLFLNPRMSFTDRSAQEYNIGIGFRQLLHDNRAIGGLNAYFDRRETARDAWFSQIGVGAEYLTHLVDLRANVYLPTNRTKRVNEFTTQEESISRTTRTETHEVWGEVYATGNSVWQQYQEFLTTRTRTTTTTTTRHFHEYELAMRGWDAEIGVRLPIEEIDDYLRTKLFAGYYHYYGRRDLDDVNGFRGRLELHVKPAFLIDAVYYADDALTGGNYSIGAYVSLPFDWSNIAIGRNPFAGATERWDAGRRSYDLRYRMTDMVRRDPQIRSVVAEPEEQEELRTVTAQATTRERTERTRREVYELLANVTFVDGNRGDDGNSGTFEDPKLTIQGGVDAANSPVVVFPLDGGAQYLENVELRAGVDLYGAYGVLGFAGKRLGGRPTIDGRLADLPAIRMANQTSVTGFRVWNTAGTATPDPLLGVPRYDRTGIYGANVTDIGLFDVIVENNMQGAMFLANAVPDFNLYVDHSVFRDNIRRGLFVRAIGTGIPNDSFNAVVHNSTFNDNNFGLFLRAMNYTDTFMSLENLTAEGNASDGIHVRVHGNQAVDAIVRVDGVTANGNERGLVVEMTGSGDQTLLVSDSSFGENRDHGLFAELAASQSAAGLFLNNRFEYNGWNVWGTGSAGILFNAVSANGDVTLLFEDNEVEGQEELGAVFNLEAPNGQVLGLFSGNLIRFNDSTGLDINATAGTSVNLNLQGNTVTENGWFYSRDGIQIDASAQNQVGVVVQDLEASSNQRNGLDITADAAAGSVLFLLEDVTANNNGDNGVWLNATADDSVIFFHHMVEASNNAANGLFAQAVAGGQVLYLIVDSTASDNGGHGIQANLTGAEGAIMVVQDSVFSGNTLDGVRFNLLANGGLLGQNAIFVMYESEALGNGDTDIHGSAQATGDGDVIIILQDVDHDSHSLSAIAEFGSSIITVTP